MGRRIQITEKQLRYILDNAHRIDEQGGQAAWEKRQQQTMAGIENVRQGQADMHEKGGKLAKAKTTGQMVVMQDVKYNTEKVEFDPMEANFYANFVTLDTGLRPEDLQSIKDRIKALKNGLVQQGYDLNNTTVNLIGTASSEPPTTAIPQELQAKGVTSLDHDYGGGQPKNEYLAQARATNIGKLIQQMIPGIKVNAENRVESCSGRACRFINLDIQGAKITKDILTVPKLTFGLSDQSGYYTTNEWNAKMAEKCGGQKSKKGVLLACCQINNGSDTRKDGEVQSNNQQKGTVFGIDPTGQGGSSYNQSVTWDWFGNGHNVYQNKVTGYKSDYATNPDGSVNNFKKVQQEVVQQVACKNAVGTTNITSKSLNNKTGGGQTGIIQLLKTSGIFSSEDAQRIAYYAKRATPMNLKGIDPKNPFDLMRKDGVKMNGEASHEQFKTFVSYCQKAGMQINPNPTKDQLIAAGAIIVNPEGKIISG